MKALVLNKQSKLNLVDWPRPKIKSSNEVLIRVHQTGICGTDRSIVVGKFSAKHNTVLGHESVGIIEQIGTAVTHLKIGMRVVINPTLYCGICEYCLEGLLNFCDNKTGNEIGIDRDGAFAEYICLPQQFCYPIPKAITFDRAVLIEPLTCSLNNLIAANLTTAEKVVILGGGPMGIITAMLALHFGAAVEIIESDPYRNRFISKLFSSYANFNSDIKKTTLARADIVIDCVGNLLEMAIQYANRNARIVIMGYDNKATANVKILKILQHGLKIIGAGDYNSILFSKAIKLAKFLPLEKLITRHYPIEDFENAFATLSTTPNKPYSELKVVLTMGHSYAH